jgi:2-amino-4-hydroxy-6-hydroxymethyldihydropteridine diphosphokinase
MTRAYVGLGANLGDAAGHVARAITALAELGQVRASSLYRSEPLGDPDQPWYVNAVAALDTELDARELLEGLRRLERRFGRAPGRPRWAPRELDLDLLLFGDRICEEPDLVLPHPGLAERRFVLEPLAELEPGARDPRTGRTASELLAGLDDPLRVEKLPAPTMR